MDKEKVTEIKKALECISGLCKDDRTFTCYSCVISQNFTEERVCKEALTLINEFESENEALWKGVKRLKKRYKETITKNADECVKKFCETVMYKEQDKLVNENQELKDQIAELKMENATRTDTIAGLLKHFVEKLKENIPVRYPSIIESIDETLKEFIDGKV